MEPNKGTLVFPKISDTFLGLYIIRTIVYWGTTSEVSRKVGEYNAGSSAGGQTPGGCNGLSRLE